MGKRVITLGTWEGKPIEWIVLKKESFGTLVISKWSIGSRYFNGNSGNNNWSDSDLRKYLNDEFFKTSFSDNEKKKILNAHLGSPDNTKDNVFILTKDEVCELLLKDGEDDYENDYNGGCSNCIWTRTKTDSRNVSHGYAGGCWCNHYPNNSYAVRPAMYIKE